MATRRALIWALAAAAVLAPAALAVASAPRWWAWIAPEQTPMTWLQSVVLVVTSVVSLLIWYVRGHLGGERRAWLVLAAGFAALAFDERFAVHERIRDGVLAPRGVTVPFLPWVGPGDFLLLAVAVVGLLVLPMVWRAMRPDPAARRLLALGVVLALVAVGLDSVDPSTWSVAAERIQQSGEEVIELASGLSLLGAVALRLLGLLDQALGGEPAAAGRHATGAQATGAHAAGGHAARPPATEAGAAGGQEPAALTTGRPLGNGS